MRPTLKVVWWLWLVVAFGVTGCAAPTRVAGVGDQFGALPWRGRLAVRVESDQTQSPSQAQSFSAGFELSGTPQVGELTLFTPLGTTVAALSWSPQTAVMLSGGETQHFASLEALIEQALGTEIPVAALFAWLAGEHRVVAGWSADLSQHAAGRITARRIMPAPAAELRLMLDQ